jgi:peptidoglycan/xylan/chitin deacetylase (PgdA/CDA1 family)
MKGWLLAAALSVVSGVAAAADCPGRPDALGTSRILSVDAQTTPRVGLKQFPETLPLEPREVVLTFDDGPNPRTTPRILDALKAECVSATFFVIGENAVAAPALLRRERADGHALGTHTWSHPLLSRLPMAAAEAEINRAIEAVAHLLGDGDGGSERRLFRFPGFAATPALLQWLEERGIVVAGADLWASDWNRMSPEAELDLLLRRLDAAGRGIILLHDTKVQTAAMVPALLRELAARDYKVVGLRAGGTAK